ncbi:MAG TPA: TonB-dependent receptor [Candidatus Acidoferrum sp.]|nr:TonB-dependent receptor [Candidatus Acidoferrum sp.]
MKNSILHRIVLFLIFVTMAGACFAQTDTARLQGTITDPQGAAVAGATVTVTNVDTGRVVPVQTNTDGFYVAAALPAGHYNVVVEKSGFQKATQNLELQLAQVGVVDFKLQVGTINQTVTVEAGSPVIDAADSSIGEVVEAKQVEEMPLNGRDFTQLALLVPGVIRGSGNATGNANNAETFRYGQEGGASLVVNGIRAQGNNFILDGIDNNEALVNTIVIFPPADAIQEFRVQTNIAPAEFGRAGGALVVTSIKSGTNDYHGSAFWFNRNKQLNAINFFSSPPTPSFVRNQFGGSVGGPIIKNKLFFFGDYQGLRQNVPSGPSYATVPTDLMRQGDFSELLNPALTTGLTLPTGPPLTQNGPNQPAPIYDPTTDGSVAATATNPNGAKQFMGSGAQPNVIPTNRQNPAAQAYLAAYPEPNCGPGRTIQDANCNPLYHNFKIERTVTENWDDWDVRGDYIIDSKNSLFARFSHGHVNQTNTTSLGVLPSGFGSGTNFNFPNGASIGLTTTVSPTFINEFRGGYVRDQYGYDPPLNNVNWCTQFGIANCYTSGVQGGIALIGAYASQIEYTGDFGVYLIPQTGFNYNDTITWIKGRHTIKAGGNVLRRELNLYRPLAGKGYFQLAGNGNSPCCGPGQGHTDTGYEIADLFAGFVDAYSHGTPFGMVGTRSWENGFFAHDDFRVTRRLTLNLGLRYDILTWPVEVGDRQANYDLTTGALVVAGSNGTLRTSIPNDYHNFGPRLGFAYQLTDDGKTVVRGGYGLFYFIDRGGISNQLAQNPPFSGENSVTYAQGYRITLTGSLPCEPGCTPAQLISTNATGPLPSGSFTNLKLSAPTGVSVVGLLPQNVTPEVSEWNLQVQREIAPNQSISLAYVGTHGAHLMRNYNANQTLYGTGTNLDPQLGSITIQDTRGKSDYNAMQIQYEHRLTAGLQVTGAFTWSKTTDDSCGNLDACAPQLYTDYAIEHGLSNQDVDYVFSPSVIYELPFGRGKRWGGDVSRWVDYAIGGWQLNAIYALQGGTPFSITASGNPSSTRADLVGNPVIHPGNIADYVEPGAFAVPAKAAGIYLAPGTSGRDMIRGPGFSNMDFALFKNFAVTERVKGQFRVQAYNLTNTPHFSNPYDTNLNDGHIGAINSVLTNSWRQVELAMRFTF